MSDDPKPASQTKEDAKKARREARAALPALYVDTWGILTWRGHVRFALGEALTDQDHYRAAFVMEVGDAERFAGHLLEVIKRRKEKDAAIANSNVELEGES